MQVMWTGADATALRNAIGISQSQFATVSGVSVPTVKKWAQRGNFLKLSDEFAAIMDTMLARATPEQVERFSIATGRKSSTSGPTEQAAAMWTASTADCATAAADLTRKDLMLDRRQATQTLLGVALGANLLEHVERWLFSPDLGRVRESGTGIGLQEVEQLENVARAFRSWDDKYGGGLRRKAVVGQLSEVNDLLLVRQTPEVAQRLRAVMAQLAETAATMSWDSGQHAMAQQYYGLAARAASIAGDEAFCAHSLAGMARQLLCMDSTVGAADALELIRIAQERGAGRLGATVEAMLYTREAWAYGRLGRPSAFQRACEKARERFAVTDPQNDPFWINYFDAAELAGTIGGRLLEMARRTPVYAAEAADQIIVAIEMRDPERLRSSALDKLGLVEARVIQGELEEACRVAHSALETVEKTTSDRVRVKAVEVLDCTERVKSVPVVAELRDRLRPLVVA